MARVRSLYRSEGKAATSAGTYIDLPTEPAHAVWALLTDTASLQLISFMA